jgi:site-specific DNA-methyltransferase (adenine-specific)
MTRVERIGDAVLYHADCRDILPALGKVDAVVTDPPYGVNLGNHLGAKDGRKDHVLVKGQYDSYEDTVENLRSVVIPAIELALSISNRALVFCAGSNIWLYPRADALGGVYLPAAQGRSKWGFSSLAHCLMYGQAPDLHLGAKPTAFWSTESAEKNGHPCPKPQGWMAWAVDTASREGETVLDPFMGSGTTGVACARHGRRFIGIEIEPRYFDIACKRIDEAQRQGRLFDPPRPQPVQEMML